MTDHEHQYPNIVRAVLETPWAIIESHFHAIVEILSVHAAGGRFTAEEIEARVGGRPSRKTSARAGDTAVVPVYGTIVPRADMMTGMSGGTPLNRFQSELSAAVKDPDVANILLDIDSPGGQVGLVQEAAADIRAATKVKPVVATANPVAASAAYWLGAAASEFVGTPSARVGSIGVFAAHDDLSGALEKAGVKTTLIHAGKYKVEMANTAPLTDEARAYAQELVDEIYQQFTADVARFRGTTVDAVRGGFGEGRVVSAKTGVRLGMLDAVEPVGVTLQRLAAGGDVTNPTRDEETPDIEDVPTGKLSGVSFSAELRHALGEVERLTETARGFADVQREGSMTTAKREQLAAALDALGDLENARSGLAALLEATDPERPRREALAAVAEYAAVESPRRDS